MPEFMKICWTMSMPKILVAPFFSGHGVKFRDIPYWHFRWNMIGNAVCSVLCFVGWCHIVEHFIRTFVASGVWAYHRDANLKYHSVFSMALVLCRLQVWIGHNWLIVEILLSSWRTLVLPMLQHPVESNQLLLRLLETWPLFSSHFGPLTQKYPTFSQHLQLILYCYHSFWPALVQCCGTASGPW